VAGHWGGRSVGRSVGRSARVFNSLLRLSRIIGDVFGPYFTAVKKDCCAGDVTSGSSAAVAGCPRTAQNSYCSLLSRPTLQG